MNTTFDFAPLLDVAPPPGVRLPERLEVRPALRPDGSPGFRASLVDLLGNEGAYAIAASPESAARGVMLALYGVIARSTGRDTTDAAARAVRLTLN